MSELPLSIGTLHFTGIGGIGMSGIAEILFEMGYRVQGSDMSDNANVKRLRDKGIKKSDLSRDEFLGHAWEWTHEHGGIILEQLKKLGASCDWNRTRFTMDKGYYKGVIDTFVECNEK